jgi:segregation and condensation protein B
LFGADALEWKAEQEAAAAEQTAEVAGEMERPNERLPLMDEVAAEVAVQAGILEDSAAAQAGTETPAGEPTDSEAEAKRRARQRERDVKSVLKQLLDELVASYDSDDRGVEIKEIAGGYRMATKPEYHDAVRLFVKSLKLPLKLSLPALETLAVVAYKQPVTSPEVSEIRGVETGGVLGSLLARKLIATAGRKPVIGRPILYKTTKEFLLRFGLKDLSELPSMEEFEKMAALEIEEMEPEAAAADAAEAAAEAEEAEAENVSALDDNSPSGEELAESRVERSGAEMSAAGQIEEQRASLGESPAATAAETSASSNEQQLASGNVVEAGAAERDRAPAENEADFHAKEEQKEP